MTQLAYRKIDKIAKDIVNDRNRSISKYGLFYKHKNEKAFQEKIASYSIKTSILKRMDVFIM